MTNKTETTVTPIRSGARAVAGNSGIHAVPVHRIIAPLAPTAHPSSGLTRDTEKSNSLVGLVTGLHSAPFQRKIVPESPTIHPSSAPTIITDQRVTLKNHNARTNCSKFLIYISKRRVFLCGDFYSWDFHSFIYYVYDFQHDADPDEV